MKQDQPMVINFPNVLSVGIIGDVHGKFEQLIWETVIKHWIYDTLFIVAGDCGLGFYDINHYRQVFENKKFMRRLEENNCYIVFVRGNHDCPAYFNNHIIDYEHLKAVKDYTVIKACNRTILCVGGAISIDREYRKTTKWYHKPDINNPYLPNVWWEDEIPVFCPELLTAIKTSDAIDTVVTHTCPSLCTEITKKDINKWIGNDNHLIESLEKERCEMDRIYKKLKNDGHPLENWYFGHFHDSWNRIINNTKFTLLNELEVKNISY